MSREYTGFPIANFRTGFNEALEPWLIPRDAFQVLRNAHLYRGVVEKISGYVLFTQMSYRTTREMNGDIDGTNDQFTAVLGSSPTTGNTTISALVGPGVIETFTDNGNGVLTSNLGGSGTINYVANSPVIGQPAGYVIVTFNTPPTSISLGGFQFNSVRLSSDAYAAPSAIMGIKRWISESGFEDILVFDEKRLAKVVVLTGAMATLQQSDYGLVEVPHETQALSITTGFNGTTGPFTGLVDTMLTPGLVEFKVFDSNLPNATLLEIIRDDGFGVLTGYVPGTTPPTPTGTTGNINYATGRWRLTFASTQPVTNTMMFSGFVYGDTFHGDFTDFFSTVNYQSKTFITNNVDPMMYYDGQALHYLNTSLTTNANVIAPYDISRCLHVTVNRERLLLIAPVVKTQPQLNNIYWSVAGDPLSFTNGEFLLAPTSEPIRTFGFINTDMVVRFSRSERVFRYTADAFAPFRWDQTNVMWACDASFSAINYDSWFSSVGRPAIVGSNGVNVTRVNEIIPDFTLNLRIGESQPVLSIDQTSIGQCYGERFDDYKEGWLCYRNFDTDSDGPVKPSNSVLAFNYMDSTYAVYTFPFSCLGFGRVITQDTWQNNFNTWQSSLVTWDSYAQSLDALINLGGDQNGKVYALGLGNNITDMAGNTIPCLFEAITKDFNPFVEQGELCRLGYVDFLVSANAETKFRVQFYKDNQLDDTYSTFYQETTLTLTGGLDRKVWKRIYVGAVGKEHTFRIYQNAEDFVSSENQPIRIHAMVPYFKAAGRIFN